MPSSIRLAPLAPAALSGIRAPVDAPDPGATPGEGTANGNAWRLGRP